MVVLDTCALIELCKAKISLSVKTIKQIEKGAYVLTISFAEIACKIKLGKLALSLSIIELYEKFSEIKSITIVDIGIDEWLDSINLVWAKNKDPADRMLVAFAQKRKLSLVTSDNKIEQFYPKVLW